MQKWINLGYNGWYNIQKYTYKLGWTHSNIFLLQVIYSLSSYFLTAKKCQQAINYGINLNVYNNNNNNNLINKYNNKLLYNNQHRLGSEKRGSVDKSCESSSTEDMLHDRVVGIKANNLYLRQQAKFPAFAADCMGGKNAAAEAAAGSSNEDNSVLAALYNKTHGGAFYHFTVSNNDNQPFVEDIWANCYSMRSDALTNPNNSL